METTKRINESGSATIQNIVVNFNWDYNEGEKPNHINAQAYSEGMDCNFTFRIETEVVDNKETEVSMMDFNFQRLKGDIPVLFLQEIKAEFETIINSFNPQ